VSSTQVDAAGNLTRLIDARGLVEHRSHDALNRLTRVSWPASGQAIRFTWDGAEGCSHGVGRLCIVNDNERRLRFAWDARGNLLRQVRIEDSGARYTTTYAHDAADRLIRLTDPTRHTTTIERNAAGLPVRITHALPGQAPQVLAEQIQSDATGRITSYRQGNGATITRTHHEDGLLALQAVSAAQSSTLSLGHDASGNVITRQRHTGASTSTASYAYDPLNRLVSETGPRTQAFGHDANGNRLSDGSGNLGYQPLSNRLSTMHGQSVVLDEAGNTLQARGLSFAWNDAGQLHSVSRTGTLLASYAYNHRGLRVRKSTSAAAAQGEGTVHYHHDHDSHLIAETTGAGHGLWLSRSMQRGAT
jgi:YD repeat-containing protein